jgi:RND superfamily putative drug exporter
MFSEERMFVWWARVVLRRRRWVLAGALAVLALGIAWGTGVFGALVSGGFDDRRSENVQAQRLIDQRIGSTTTDVVVLFRNPSVSVDDPAYQAAVDRAMRQFPAGAARVQTYWNTRSPGLVSTDRHATFVAVSLKDRDADIKSAAYQPLRHAVDGTGYAVQIGGRSGINSDITDRVRADIERAELLSMPVLLVLLVLVFGSVVAALLPLAIGGLAILGAFAVLRVLTSVTDVSIFAINIITLMSLGLAIDYGLFMVSRFREELGRGRAVRDAVVRTMATAGRTVAVSATTVAVALSRLLIFPQVFLGSMALGGIAAALIAAAGALSVLPALLMVLGRRVDAWSVRPLLGRLRIGRSAVDAHGFWYRLAMSVMRRPVIYIVAVVALLGVLAAPFLNVKFGGVDARVLPAAAYCVTSGATPPSPSRRCSAWTCRRRALPGSRRSSGTSSKLVRFLAQRAPASQRRGATRLWSP